MEYQHYLDRPKKTYAEYRSSMFASINGTKGNLVRLSKSKLVKPAELEVLLKVISSIDDWREVFNKTREEELGAYYTKRKLERENKLNNLL